MAHYGNNWTIDWGNNNWTSDGYTITATPFKNDNGDKQMDSGNSKSTLNDLFDSIVNNIFEDKKGENIVGSKKVSVIPVKIIFNNPATIVYWDDGSKTVSKVSDGEKFVEEVGFMACVMKKIYGNRSAYMRLVENAYRQPKKQE